MVDFLYHEDYIINGDVLCKANTSEWAPTPNMQGNNFSPTHLASRESRFSSFTVNGYGNSTLEALPPGPSPPSTPPPAVVRDSLLCHVEVNAIGHHYKLPKLCDRANKYIQDIISSDEFPVEIFPYLAIAAHKSSEDAQLHDLVFSFTAEHVQILLNTTGFEKLTTLPNFGLKLLQKTVAKLQANENQLAKMQDQRVRDQEIINTLQQNLSGLKDSFSAASTECDLATKKNLDLVMERDSAQRALDEERKQKLAAVSERDRISQGHQEALDAERKKYTTLSSQRNALQQQVRSLTTQYNDLTTEKDTAKNETTALKKKIGDALGIVNRRGECRNCGNGFGSWIQDLGPSYLVRCYRCKCRHWD